MAITNMDGSASITNAEFSLPNNSTSLTAQTDDCTMQVFIDAVTNMVAGDQFHLQIKEKVNGSGSTQRIVYEAWLKDVQTGLFVTPAIIVTDGWDVTLTRVSASSRTIAWSIRKIT